MRKISTHAELKAEQQRLRAKRAFLENEIKRDFRELKENLEPINLLKKGAKKTLESREEHVLGDSIGDMAKMLAKIAFKRSGWVSGVILPVVLKKVTSSLVEKNKGKIIDWASHLFQRFSRPRTLTGGT